MNQNFSTQQLLKFCKKNEIVESDISKADFKIYLESVTQRVNENKIDFHFKKVNGNYLTEDLAEKLILRKLNDNIKRIYKDEQANRRIIISQIIVLLEETCPMYLIKTDIEGFYENINKQTIVNKLKEDGLLSYQSILILEHVLFQTSENQELGLPRGLSISSTLSEIYMRKFDRWLRQYEGVYYFSRYVDDIIVFTIRKQIADKLNSEFDSKLPDGLRKNAKKTKIYSVNDSLSLPLEYLGYKFTTKKRKKEKFVSVSIADNKIRKIKTRIVKSFLDYLKNNDFDLLENRIKFLTGNFSIKKNPEGNELKAGIFYNYSYLNDFGVLLGLNIFFHKILNSKNGSLGRKLNASLATERKQILSKYSFLHGYKKKVFYHFEPEFINKIKRCW